MPDELEARRISEEKMAEPKRREEKGSEALSARPSDVFSSVPSFKEYFPTVGSMSKKVRAFYRHWLERWQAGDPINVDGNISYFFVYCYDVLSWHQKGAYDEIITEFCRLRSAYAHEKKFAQRLLWWLADTYVLKGDFKSALATMHTLDPSLNSLVTLKHIVNEHMAASEVYYLTSKPALTKFGCEHKLEVLDQLSNVLREYETERDINLLGAVIKRIKNTGYSVYGGSSYQHSIDLPEYELDWVKVRARSLEFKGMVREAENRVREIHKVPRIKQYKKRVKLSFSMEGGALIALDQKLEQGKLTPEKYEAKSRELEQRVRFRVRRFLDEILGDYGLDEVEEELWREMADLCKSKSPRELKRLFRMT